MKTKIGILLAVILFLTQACSAGVAAETSTPQEPIVPSATAANPPDAPHPTLETTLPEVIQTTPVDSTTVVLSALPTLTPFIESTETDSSTDNLPSDSSITLNDNNKTFTMKVGDYFLLNLGTDIYNWTVTIDNESVLHLKMGVMVIKGAQGIYDALAPGTAVLSASGEPICLQANLPCGVPSILFTVTIIVE
jgi:hypothetical protein